MPITFESKPAGLAKIKVLIMGDSGVGKTHFGLTFPNPLVVDTENALPMFRNRFTFKEATTRSYSEINELMDQAIAKRVPGDTLIIDSLTSIYTALQDAHPNDPYMKTTTKKFRSLIDKLYGKVPMHVVMTAWEKPEYAPVGSIIEGTNEKVGKDDRVITGYKMDGNSKAIYAFDFVLRLQYDAKKRMRYATVVKSRSDKWKPGDVIQDPSWEDFKGLVSGLEFQPSMSNDEAAIIDNAADAKSKNAPQTTTLTVAPEKQKTLSSVPAFGGNTHIKELFRQYMENSLEREYTSELDFLKKNKLVNERGTLDIGGDLELRKSAVEKLQELIKSQTSKPPVKTEDKAKVEDPKIEMLENVAV